MVVDFWPGAVEIKREMEAILVRHLVRANRGVSIHDKRPGKMICTFEVRYGALSEDTPLFNCVAFCEAREIVDDDDAFKDGLVTTSSTRSFKLVLPSHLKISGSQNTETIFFQAHVQLNSAAGHANVRGRRHDFI